MFSLELMDQVRRAAHFARPIVQCLADCKSQHLVPCLHQQTPFIFRHPTTSLLRRLSSFCDFARLSVVRELRASVLGIAGAKGGATERQGKGRGGQGLEVFSASIVSGVPFPMTRSHQR